MGRVPGHEHLRLGRESWALAADHVSVFAASGVFMPDSGLAGIRENLASRVVAGEAGDPATGMGAGAT